MIRRHPGARARAAALAGAAMLTTALVAVDPAGGQPAPAATADATPRVDESAVHEVAAQLRCVVCQSLSVADSPSETAQQMRALIRERLARGETAEQVRAYFVDKYGIWILLAPPRSGFTLLVWVLPFAALLAGLAVVATALWRWRRPARAATPDGGAPSLAPAMRERIRRETAELDR